MKRMQKFLTVLATSSLLCSQLAIDTVSIYAANGQENQASTTGTTSTSSGEATASSSTSVSTTESASTSTTDSSASSQEGATSQSLEVIEEAPAHEEEEKKPTLRGGSPQITDWTYTEDGTTITLTGYTGSSTDVVIPTAQDLGFDESYTAQISKEVLRSVAKTSLSTSTNGKKIVVSSTDLNECFKYKYSLTTMNLSNLDVSNVTDMSFMFSNCRSLTSLDLSHFDTSNVTNMTYMFYDCSSLTSLDLSSWNCDKVTSYGSMFRTSDSTPLLVKTTDTILKNYNYASDNRTKLGKVKIAAEKREI